MSHPQPCPGLLLMDSPAKLNGNGPGRREIKFPFRRADVGTLRRVLESNCVPVSFSDEVSTVRSIYFDDPLLSACRANLDGVGQRTKLRLRWYDSPWPGGSFYLEIKWRRNLLTGKARLRLGSPACLSSVPFSALVSQLLDIVPDEFREELLRRSEPIVLVEYKRRHFVSRDRSLRVTLDYDLKFHDLCGRTAMHSAWPVGGEDLLVVEGKAPAGRQTELAPLLHPLSPRAARNSKYVLGCRALGLIHPRDY